MTSKKTLCKTQAPGQRLIVSFFLFIFLSLHSGKLRTLWPGISCYPDLIRYEYNIHWQEGDLN